MDLSFKKLDKFLSKLFGFHTTVVLLFTLILLHNPTFTEGKAQYVQPLNMGMQVAIPYDIANIFNRPVNFGPVSAILSASGLLFILFFGVITSPFGYFFGVPSEKYVLGDSWQNLSGIGTKAKDKDAPSRSGVDYPSQDFQNEDNQKYQDQEYPRYQDNRYPRALNNANDTQNGDSGSGRVQNSGGLLNSDFEHQIFSRLPHLKNVECRKMMLCSAHRGLENYPESILKGYHFFSRKLKGISTDYKNAIIRGIRGQDSCEDIYASCNDSVFGILIRTVTNLMPKWSRRKSSA